MWLHPPAELPKNSYRAIWAGLSDHGDDEGLVRVDVSEQVPHVRGHDCDLTCFRQRACGCGERRHADVRARD